MGLNRLLEAEMSGLGGVTLGLEEVNLDLREINLELRNVTEYQKGNFGPQSG